MDPKSETVKKLKHSLYSGSGHSWAWISSWVEGSELALGF